jgi:hypothetical protein
MTSPDRRPRRAAIHHAAGAAVCFRRREALPCEFFVAGCARIDERLGGTPGVQSQCVRRLGRGADKFSGGPRNHLRVPRAIIFRVPRAIIFRVPRAIIFRVPRAIIFRVPRSGASEQQKKEQE